MSQGKTDVVAPSSAPILVMVALPVALMVLAPGPKYSMIAPVPPFTDFAGLYARATGKPPFDLAPSLARAKAKLPLDQRLNLVTTNDIIGGNSGSPLIDKEGRLVGLVFDGNIYSLGGDYGFDPRVNRTVAVHVGAILAALRTAYGAGHLADEMSPP